MTRFGKHSILWLAAGSLAAAIGTLSWHVTATGAARAQAALQQIAPAQESLNTLKRNYAKWKRVTPHGRAAGKGTLRVEPVALSVSFSPSDFKGIGPMLGEMYAANGALNVQNFTLDVQGGGTVQVALRGEKVFVQQ